MAAAGYSSSIARLIHCSIVFVYLITGVESNIGCYICNSFNNSDPNCEDTFNSSYGIETTASHTEGSYYQFPCWSYRKNRQGQFPADHCIKVSGYRTDYPNQTITIRTCALDSGTLTADTEIVRISHCGNFKYGGNLYVGCVQSCDTDGCNRSSPIITSSTSIVHLLFALIAMQQLQRILSTSSLDN